ncbi:cytochrome c3 family protein [Thiobacillus sp. 0-1251]|uniref:cytochrome c3 family protein n=2 Tax=Thiobacillus TaxID=919 RepID=UPI0025E7C77E|nr:cytochrome c3 family protein [Thiobacillus sp. 0-1251]
MNHSAVISATCESCHNGTYTSSGAQAKPINHIPTALVGGKDCKACHTSTASWSTMKMDHNNILTGCKTCHASGTSYLGSMEKKSVTHQSKTATDCSQSGCHRPLGNKGVAYVKWD